MKKMKKGIMLLVIIAMIGALSGCGESKDKQKSGQPENNDVKKDTDEPIELSMLINHDPATSIPEKLTAIEEAAEKLGYKVNIDKVDDETYKTKIRVMLQGNELPDLFFTWGGSYSTPFLQANALYPLGPAIEKSGYKLLDVYKQPDENGNVYTVPLGALESYCLFYNKDVFKKIGKEVPADWDGLLDVVDACNSAGIGTLGLADKDRWEGDLFYNMMVVREDADAFAKAIKEGGTFTAEPFVEAARKVKTLIDKNAFQSGYMQATTSECIELLKSGKIAMYPAGSWEVSLLQNEENIGCTVFPQTGAEDPYLSCCGNAADAGIVVSANSKNPEAAAKLAVEYSKTLNDYLAKNGQQTYFETDKDKEAPKSEMMTAYIDNFNKMEKSQLWWYTYMDTAIGEPMRDLSQQQFAGDISAEDFIEQLEKIIKGK